MDFQTLIDSTRQKVRRVQQGYDNGRWKKDRIKKPLKLYLIRDRRFDPQLRSQRDLLERGKVVWSAFIQANQLLFKPDDPHPMLPAAIMYSATKVYDSDPELLVEHAHDSSI